MPKKKGGKAALRKKANKKAKAKQNKKAKSPPNKQKKSIIDDEEVAALLKSVKVFNRDITINKLTVEPIDGGADLIEECTLKLTHGHRYGLIGYNGAGKSTLLRKLASGTIKEIPKYLRILHTQQELKVENLTVLETVLKSDKLREYLLRKEKELRKEMEFFDDSTNSKQNKKKKKNKQKKENNDSERLDELLNHLEDITGRLHFIESDTAESRASNLLTGLGFSKQMKNMKICDLSGGWRMRVTIASALFIEPDLLLLDEPTNHLDLQSVLWLTEYLNYQYHPDKTIVIVSHDRQFLNDCCTDIIHLNKKKLTFYTGNYDLFIKIRNEMKINQNKQYERQQKMIQHNQEFIAKFAANKKWSTQAQSRRKMLEKLEIIEKVEDDMKFNFEFNKPTIPLKNSLIINFNNVTFGYFGEDKPDTFILKKINVRFEYGSKIGILGANGAGKSTLIKLIMNKVKPLFGTALLTNSVQIGYFSQHHVDNLDLNLTPLQQLEKEFGSANITRQGLFAQLGRFNMGSELAQKKIGTLSGGQKSRITFAILSWYSPHLIIMDEPTNHLDIPTIDGLANALKEFGGSVLIVSHDQHFVETCCDEFWCVGNKKIKIFNDFNKCKTYSKTCKAPNNLPREYNKKQNKNKNNNEKKEIEREEKQKEKKVLKNNNHVKNYQIDIEREIEKGLKKDLTPDQILRHCKGWKCADGEYMIVNKLGFIIFGRYFDNDKIHQSDFFKKWKKLLQYCIPTNHIKNQLKLLNIATQCFTTAYKDKKKKAVESTYSFGLILESMIKEHDIINMDVVHMFINKNVNKQNENVFLNQMQQFVQFEDEEDSDDDSYSD